MRGQGTGHHDILDRIDDFVAACLPGRDELIRSDAFPADVWRGLAGRGLLGAALPPEFGGLGCDWRTLAEGARRMTGTGAVMGVTLTWLCHNMNARLHLQRLGTAAQRAAWLPALARGEGSLTVAISEPGAGAHPKYLKTTARRDGNDFVIDGEKSYLTNGPLASLFVVLAVTGARDGRKTFSAIVVPRGTPGLTETPGVEIGFLKPAPHCGLELKGCRVPAANLLGEPDAGFTEISLPMRAVEDALAASSLAGAVQAQLRLLAQAGGFHRDNDAVADFGELLMAAEFLAAAAAELASALDADHVDPERLAPRSAGFRRFVHHLQDDIDAFTEGRGQPPATFFSLLRRDVVRSLGIAGTAHRLRAAKLARTRLDDKDAS